LNQFGSNDEEIGQRLLNMSRTQNNEIKTLSIWLILLTEYWPGDVSGFFAANSFCDGFVQWTNY
jgi:hypothetical protein